MSKKIKAPKGNQFNRTIPDSSGSSDDECVVWKFDKLDKGGEFAFNIDCDGFRHHDFLDKMIIYSNRKWSEIKRDTHDKAKSKHHFLESNELSKAAQERIRKLKLEEYSDSIFSFSFDNKLRVIGIREDELFHVVWYDPEHKFCPSHLKHT